MVVDGMEFEKRKTLKKKLKIPILSITAAAVPSQRVKPRTAVPMTLLYPTRLPEQLKFHIIG